MAGLGRRTFAPGEVLTASNVMNYLQDQVIQTYAGTAARGSAIGTAVSEGMVSYLADNNFVQVHDGTAWRSLSGVQVASGTAVRDALLPSPVQGDAVFRNDLGYIERYYALYNVSTNPGGLSVAGWYRDFGRGQRAILGAGIKNNSTGAQNLPASYVDLNDLPVTVVTSGLPVLITSTITMRNGASGAARWAAFRLFDGATQLTNIEFLSTYYNTVTDHSTVTFYHRYTPSAGTRTIKIQATGSTGSAIQFMSGELKVEEVYE